MKAYKKFLLPLIFLLYGNMAQAIGFTDETLHYVITYKWGLIHKDSGDATLKLINKGDKYELILTGKTKPWADKFYQVRDTLLGTVTKKDFKPLSYTKIAHEKGKYSRDEISYSYHGSSVNGTSKCYRQDKDGSMRVKTKQLQATGEVFDMLSVFYYLRTIDYSKLLKNEEIKSTVFSGTKAELLTVKCVGKEVVKLRNKTTKEAYHIKFKFTQEGKKKSSEDIDAWISIDFAHIPLLVVGSLPLGQVKCYYID